MLQIESKMDWIRNILFEHPPYNLHETPQGEEDISHCRDFFEITRATFMATFEPITSCVRTFGIKKLKESPPPPSYPPIYHFSRSFDESFIRHVVTSVNYPPPSPLVSRGKPSFSKGLNTVAGILHKPVHLTLLLTAKNEGTSFVSRAPISTNFRG